MTSALPGRRGLYREERAANLLDGGAPFYDVYETADGRHLAVGSLEPQFYDDLVELLGLADTAPDRNDPANHPARSARSSPRPSGSGRRRSGRRSSTARTPASRRCCR